MTDHIAKAKTLITHAYDGTNSGGDAAIVPVSTAAIAHALIAIAEALQPDAQIADAEVPSYPGTKPEPMQVSDEDAAQNEIARAVVSAALALGISHIKLSDRYDIARRVVNEIQARFR